jgi:hypothetical protein
VWVAHNGLVGEAFTDPPVAATTPQSAKDLSGPVIMLTIPPSNERYLSEVYAGDNIKDDSAAADAGGFIGPSFIGFAVTVGVVALL